MQQRQGKERECKNEYNHCYRSGTGNNDYLKCSNDREKSASAKKNITIVTGRDTGNKNY